MFYIILVVFLVLIFWGVGIYNSLIRLRHAVEEAWSNITVLLKRRYDLIPNLVETVKGYASHEKTTLENVTAARTASMNASSPAAIAKAEEGLTLALKSLFAVSENYPDLKANQNFLSLQVELAETENKIQGARTEYNKDVMKYNVAVESFPGNIIAGQYGFLKKEYFELTEEHQKEVQTAPAVRF